MPELLDLEQTSVSARKQTAMIIKPLAQKEAEVATALTKVKSAVMVGTIGAWYDKRGDAEKIKGIYSQKEVEFRYTEAADSSGDDDSSLTYSIAGVAFLTAALAL
jgi:hypothetical protein